MSERRVLKATLYCSDPNCNKKAKITLIENSQGFFKRHEYTCADCLGCCTIDTSVEDWNAYNAKYRNERTEDGNTVEGSKSVVEGNSL